MASLEGTVDQLDEADRSLVRRARQFAEQHVAPFAASWERDRRVPLATFEIAAEHGLTLMLQPDEGSTKAPSLLGVARAAEEIGAGCLTIALPLLAQNYVAWGIARYGSPSVRAEFLPLMRLGRTLGGFCLTEPGAGSNASAITSTVRRKQGKWTLHGEKAWVMLGTQADFYIVFARTEGGAAEGDVGLFLVRKNADGVEVGDPYAMVGGHALGCTSIRFAGVEVRDEDVLLQPGKGFDFALEAIDYARIYVAAVTCGMLRTGISEALAYTSTRRVFGKVVIDFQGPQWMLAEATTDLVAARALVDQAFAHVGDQARLSVAAAHAKKFATRVALPALSDCTQLLGANGLLANNASGRHLLCAKIAQYLDGTTEIQNHVIARSLIRSLQANKPTKH